MVNDTEKLVFTEDEPPTQLNEAAQRRRWREEDVSRLEKALVKTQWRSNVIAMLIVALVGSGLWFMTYLSVIKVRSDVAAEQTSRRNTEQRVEAFFNEKIGIDKFNALNDRVKIAEGAILDFTVSFRKLDTQLRRMDDTIGAATTLVAVMSKDLTAEAKAREKLTELQRELITSMETLSAELAALAAKKQQ